MTAPAPLNSPSRRRGFTLLEVLLALILSAMVVSGVFGLMALMSASEARHSARFNTTVDRAAAQECLRTSFRRLFSAEALAQPAPTGEQTGEEQPPADDAKNDNSKKVSLDEHGADRGDRSEVAKLVRSVLGETDLADRLLDSMDEEEPPHFFLYYPDSSSGLAATLPRLQLTLTETPVPIIPIMEHGRIVSPFRSSDDLFRGAIQFAATDLPDGSAVMQWQPEDPPGRPTTLMSGVTQAVITVLPQQSHGGSWESLWAAYLKEDFPVAVHIELTLNTGEQLDWLFETTVLAPPRAMKPGGLPAR
ncbi:MAG TPA: prepilin-type N-terminal cleavage/methylation domain-containing protein [Phycisphaerales bacterium]|nr:prepilin-type N-terminal cleavage/methylation domain-containing protein [Phycisphaerales bacterium]